MKLKKMIDLEITLRHWLNDNMDNTNVSDDLYEYVRYVLREIQTIDIPSLKQI